jgi:hypothetical protein
MRPPKNKWPTTAMGNGALFFAQLVTEMLNSRSFEGFRAYTLGTVARLNEALEVIRDVETGKIPLAALEPIWGELIWSLNVDPVAKELAGDEIDEIITRLGKQNPTLALAKKSIIYLKALFNHQYQKKLEQLITNSFANSNQRIILRTATYFYISHVINQGYSRSYVAQAAEKSFYSADVKRVRAEALKKFFAWFTVKEKVFDVYVALSTEMANYIKDLKLGVIFTEKKLHVLPKTEFKKLGFNQHLFLHVALKAIDSYGAALQVDQKLASVGALIYLAPKGHPMKWEPDMYVIPKKSKKGDLVRRVHVDFDKDAPSGGRALKDAKKYSKRILSSFDESSTERLLNSINSCALARKSPSSENQLISLWSAFEILLSDPPTGTVRILHYIEQLVPCICYRHIRRQIVALYDELKIIYRHRFLKIIQKETSIGAADAHTQFAAVIFLPENETLRKELFELCEDNPLACHRIWKTVTDFGTPANICRELERHENLVKWQLQRIYRARNNLVHAGRVPPYLDSLTLNAFEYYRSLVSTLINRSSKQDSKSNIDQTVAAIELEYTIYKKNCRKIQKSESFDLVFLRKLVHG